MYVSALQAAKSLGQTLRAFQPTIREVVEVSQEIKGTLEQVRRFISADHCCWQATGQAKQA
jgi:hypothetical protein